MKELWKSWDRLSTRIAWAEKVALILDFDGTLSPLVSRPSVARLPVSLRAALHRLNGFARCHVMVLSGRRIEDVRKRVGIPSFYYGGNHGLELSGSGLSFLHPVAQRLKPRLHELATEARKAMWNLAGVHVENKGLSMSIHYRQVGVPSMPVFQRRFRRLKDRLAGTQFRWRPGHKVWELLPRVDWDKGQAVKLFLEHLRNPLAVAIGDDLTDEDMFRVLKGKGISIRTVPEGKSAADYCLRGQWDVLQFLQLFDEILQHGGHS